MNILLFQYPTMCPHKPIYASVSREIPLHQVFEGRSTNMHPQLPGEEPTEYICVL